MGTIVERKGILATALALDNSGEVSELAPLTSAWIVRPATRGLLSGAALASGYRPENDSLDRAFNCALASVLLLLAAPIFLMIIILQKATSPGDVFYRGARLGRYGKAFEMLKFRTLETEGRALTTDRILPRRNLVETPLGRYLRMTRLDELPQLVNVLRGDMAIYGPRPVRPEIAARCAAEIPNYHIRFSVRPGLIGLTQALMTHGTAKSARARLNNSACRAPVRYCPLLRFAALTAWHVVLKTLRAGVEFARDRFSPLGEHHWLHTGFSRPSRTRVEVEVDGDRWVGALCGISDEVIHFVSPTPFPSEVSSLTIIRNRGRRRRMTVRVDAVVRSVTPLGPCKAGFVHYATYRPATSFGAYRIDRYLIGSALVSG